MRHIGIGLVALALVWNVAGCGGGDSGSATGACQLCDKSPQPIPANSNQPTGPYKGVYALEVDGSVSGGTFVAHIEYNVSINDFSGWCWVTHNGNIIEAKSLSVTPGGNTRSEDTVETCQDGIDNDNNGYIDCGDWSCSKNKNPQVDALCTGPPEDTVEACQDGIDNDQNGYTDCGDFQCSKNKNPQVAALCTGPPEDTVEACQDGIDNDNNGYTDCGDWSCSKNTNPQVAALCAGRGTGRQPSASSYTIEFASAPGASPSFSLTFQVAVDPTTGAMKVVQTSVNFLLNNASAKAVIGKETPDQDCTCYEGTWSGGKLSGAWNFLTCGDQIDGIYEGSVGGSYTGTIKNGVATIIQSSGSPLATGNIGSSTASGEWSYLGQTGTWSGYQSCD